MKKIQKLIFNPNNYLSLADAKELNNERRTDAGWVFDRFSGEHVVETEGMTTEQLMDAMDKWVANLPDENCLEDSLFRLAKVETFDSQEQIDWLISQRKFFYA